MLGKISRNEVHNAIDKLIDYYKQLEMSAIYSQDETHYKSLGALEALQKLKHELDMEMSLSPYRIKQRRRQKEKCIVDLKEIIEIFKNTIPSRTPTKYAQSENKWYVYSENKVDNGKHLPTLIENGWYCIEDGKCYPVTPLDMPHNITMSIVPFDMR